MERFWLMQEKSKHLKSLFPQAGTIYPPLLYEMHKRPEYPTAKLLISNNRRKNAECILVIPPTPKKQLSDFALVYQCTFSFGMMSEIHFQDQPGNVSLILKVWQARSQKNN